MHKVLTTYQRIVYGLINTGVFSCTALLEGVVLFHYSDSLHVSLEYLGLANFVIGALAAYFAIIGGNLSDRAKSKYRRKAYVLIFGPLYAAGLFFRLGGFTSEKFAPIYYIISYSVQTIGYTGLDVITQAWGVELASEVSDRNNLYSISTGCSFAGVFLGLVFALLPLKIAAVVLTGTMVLAIILAVLQLPDNTPLTKRAFIPTVANMSSVFWNSQFVIYLVASCFTAILNTIPPLMMFFIKFCMDIKGDAIARWYSTCVAVFVVMGVVVLPFMRQLVDRFGSLACVKFAIGVAAAMGLVMFVFSYVDMIFIVVAFGLVGSFSTVANVVLSIIYAETVDYDELLCGKKRGSSYSAVHTPIRLFIQIAGGSIPLMLMAALGFKNSDDDHDDTSTSTFASTLVLRLWCTLAISLCMLGSYYYLSLYQIDESKHKQILVNIGLRDRQNGLRDAEPECDVVHEARTGDLDASTESAEDIVDAVIGDIQRATDGAALQKLLAGDNAETEADIVGLYRGTSLSENKPPALLEDPTSTGISADQRAGDLEVMLTSVEDPLTGRPVSPPPFALIIQLIDQQFPAPASEPGDADSATHRDHIELRMLALYFPQLLQVCCSVKGRSHLINIYFLELLLSLAVCTLGAWQSVEVLKADNQDAAYFMVVLTVIYSFYFAYEVMKMKGVLILRSLQSNPRPELEEMIRAVVEAAYERGAANPGLEDVDDLDSDKLDGDNGGSVPLIQGAGKRGSREYRLSVHMMLMKAATRGMCCVVSFVAAYLAVDLTS